MKVPGIVVYDSANDKSWRAYHQTMEDEEGADTVDVPDYPLTFQAPIPNVDGIALSPRSNDSNDRLYIIIYTPIIFKGP